MALSPAREAWVQQVVPYARQVEALTGIRTSAVLAWMAHETQFGESTVFLQGNNLFGYRTYNVHWQDGKVLAPNKQYYGAYTSWQRSVDHTIATVQRMAAYEELRRTVASTTDPREHMLALGRSPWSQERYLLNGIEGGNLLQRYAQGDLGRYDQAAIADPPLLAQDGWSVTQPAPGQLQISHPPGLGAQTWPVILIMAATLGLITISSSKAAQV